MSEQNPSPKADILIVDDTPANLRLLSQMLAERGYKVRAAISGARALETTRARLPDLILLDIRMPEMDGYQVCQQLKQAAETRDIPIIFISALGETDDKIKAFAVGGVDYITKPFQVAEVLARIQTHLSLRELQKQLQVTNQELARRLEEIANSNSELQTRNQELDAFAHTVAHDLKNPLSSMIGYSTMLAAHHTEMPEQELNQVLEAIEKNGRKMTNIIDELLLLASVRKIEDIDLFVLDTGRILEEVRKRLQHLIDRRQAEIKFPQEWPPAMGYAPWVEEIWSNYMSNAIQYGGNPPRLELGAERQPDGAVRFWVCDNGDGLTPEEQSRLFTPFTRLHQARAQGYGLGLSIVQRIAEKLGGQVGVESQPDQGSRFFFTLPGADG
ncbi:MAG: hybrid sensor histidine kinase/response regulator [Anaerolineales bacterium]|nr:hybrid sensor histidine kinase/response regulator [Anaerolineales bacterium]